MSKKAGKIVHNAVKAVRNFAKAAVHKGRQLVRAVKSSKVYKAVAKTIKSSPVYKVAKKAVRAGRNFVHAVGKAASKVYHNVVKSKIGQAINYVYHHPLQAAQKVAKAAGKVVHNVARAAVKAGKSAVKAVKTFVKKNANTITTVLTVVSIAATVVAFSTGIGEVATVAGGVALGIDTAFTAMNASNAITGHDLLTGAPLSNGSRVLNGVLAVAGVAAPFAAPLVSKGVRKIFGKSGVVEVNIPKNIYPETAQHIDDAIKAGQPSKLTIAREGAKANRRASLKGIKTIPGKDRDEFPPAMFKEGGKGADVRHISPSDNRGAGASMSHQLKGYPDGTKVKFNTQVRKK